MGSPVTETWSLSLCLAPLFATVKSEYHSAAAAMARDADTAPKKTTGLDETVDEICRAAQPGVSTVVEQFERLGILKVERGRLLIGDREQLLRISCDCYAVIKAHYEQVGR